MPLGGDEHLLPVRGQGEAVAGRPDGLVLARGQVVERGWRNRPVRQRSTSAAGLPCGRRSCRSPPPGGCCRLRPGWTRRRSGYRARRSRCGRPPRPWPALWPGPRRACRPASPLLSFLLWVFPRRSPWPAGWAGPCEGRPGRGTRSAARPRSTCRTTGRTGPASVEARNQRYLPSASKVGSSTSLRPSVTGNDLSWSSE